MKNIRTNHTKAFIYWHQGWTQAPKVAQYCLKSWLDSAFNVIQIDSENFKNYIGQSHLTNMLNKIANRVGKDVSYQHFADLLRLTLLAENKYSLWVDSTVYLNDPNKLTSQLNHHPKLPPGRVRNFETWLIYNGHETKLFESWAIDFYTFLNKRFTEIDDWEGKTFLSSLVQELCSRKVQRYFYLSIWNRLLFRYRTYFQTNFVGEKILGSRLNGHQIFFFDTQANEIAHYSPETIESELMVHRLTLSPVLKLNHKKDKVSEELIRCLSESNSTTC